MLKKLSAKTNFILIGIIVGLFVGVSIRQALGDTTNTSGTARADNLTVNIAANAENGLAVANGNLLVPNGNIGIGTTTPTVKLDVVGDIKTTGSITTGSIKSNNLCIGATCINENQLKALLAVGGTGTNGTERTVTPGTGTGTDGTGGTVTPGTGTGTDGTGGTVTPETTTRICNDDILNPSNTICNNLSNTWMDITWNRQNRSRGWPELYLFVNGVFILMNGGSVELSEAIASLTSGSIPVQWGSNNATSCTLNGVSVPNFGAKTLTEVENGNGYVNGVSLRCTNSTGTSNFGVGYTAPAFSTPTVTSSFTPSTISSTGFSVYRYDSQNTIRCVFSHPDGKEGYDALGRNPSFRPTKFTAAIFPNGLTNIVTCYNSLGESAVTTATLTVTK